MGWRSTSSIKPNSSGPHCSCFCWSGRARFSCGICFSSFLLFCSRECNWLLWVWFSWQRSFSPQIRTRMPREFIPHLQFIFFFWSLLLGGEHLKHPTYRIDNDLYHGILPNLAASLLSGLAAGLSQRVLQSQKRNSYIYTMELCIYSLLTMLITSVTFFIIFLTVFHRWACSSARALSDPKYFSRTPNSHPNIFPLLFPLQTVATKKS